MYKIIINFLFILSLSFGDYFTDAISKSIFESDLDVETLCVYQASLINGEENEICNLYLDRLAADLLTYKKYKIVDRANFTNLLQEIELSQSGLMDEGSIKEIGKIISADGFISLTIAELEEGTEIITKITKVESSEIIFAQSFRDFKETEKNDSKKYTLPDAYKGIKIEEKDFKKNQNSRETMILNPDSKERHQKLSYEYREKNKAQIEEMNRMRYIKENNPALYEKITLAHENFGKIARDWEALIIFIMHYNHTFDTIQKRHPDLAKRIASNYSRINKLKPEKAKLVRKYIADNKQILQHEKQLQKKIDIRINSMITNMINNQGKHSPGYQQPVRSHQQDSQRSPGHRPSQKR